MKKNISLLLLAAMMMSGCCTSEKYQTTTQRDINQLTKSASFAMPEVPVPSFPSRTFNILEYGADPTGAVASTEAIQKAIDECTEAGGGTVIIPEGIYQTAPITLKSNVRLYTEKNSFVVFSHDLDDYEIYDEWFEGIPTKRCTSPLNARDAENIAITGYGTFNGNGDWWRPLKKSKMAPTQWKKHLKEKGGIVTEKDIWYPDSASLLAQSYCVDQNVPVITDDSLWQVVKSFLRPVMLHFVGCKNILLEGVTFENSPAWNLHPMCC
jgi:polygalacturonase